jgi:hypothetical protein
MRVPPKRTSHRNSQGESITLLGYTLPRCSGVVITKICHQPPEPDQPMRVERQSRIKAPSSAGPDRQSFRHHKLK